VLGAIVLYVPIYAIEYPVGVSTSPWRGVSWKQMSRGMPSWVTPCVVLLSLIYVGHFIWFTLHTGLGVPSIRDGQYVIGSRERNLRTLSSSEYFVLKAEELRMLATLMITAYFMPMMYWWFRRNEQPTT
jgi:hypothetical protein